MAQWVRSLDLTTHTSLSPIRRGFVPGFVNYKKWCTWLTAASDKVYQLLAHGWWLSPASSTTKTGRHDIAEMLLKVALKHQKSIKSISIPLSLKHTFICWTEKKLWKRKKNHTIYWLHKFSGKHNVPTVYERKTYILFMYITYLKKMTFKLLHNLYIILQAYLFSLL